MIERKSSFESTEEIIERMLNSINDRLERIEKKLDIDNEKEKKEKRHKYGKYENVLLSDEQLEKLKLEFPYDWEERIERISDYCKMSGKTYKDYLAVARAWAKKENKTNREDIMPTYSATNNVSISSKEKKELQRLMRKEV